MEEQHNDDDDAMDTVTTTNDEPSDTDIANVDRAETGRRFVTVLMASSAGMLPVAQTGMLNVMDDAPLNVTRVTPVSSVPGDVTVETVRVMSNLDRRMHAVDAAVSNVRRVAVAHMNIVTQPRLCKRAVLHPETGKPVIIEDVLPPLFPPHPDLVHVLVSPDDSEFWHPPHDDVSHVFIVPEPHAEAVYFDNPVYEIPSRPFFMTGLDAQHAIILDSQQLDVWQRWVPERDTLYCMCGAIIYAAPHDAEAIRALEAHRERATQERGDIHVMCRAFEDYESLCGVKRRNMLSRAGPYQMVDIRPTAQTVRTAMAADLTPEAMSDVVAKCRLAALLNVLPLTCSAFYLAGALVLNKASVTVLTNEAVVRYLNDAYPGVMALLHRIMYDYREFASAIKYMWRTVRTEQQAAVARFCQGAPTHPEDGIEVAFYRKEPQFWRNGCVDYTPWTSELDAFFEQTVVPNAIATGGNISPTQQRWTLACLTSYLQHAQREQQSLRRCGAEEASRAWSNPDYLQAHTEALGPAFDAMMLALLDMSNETLEALESGASTYPIENGLFTPRVLAYWVLTRRNANLARDAIAAEWQSCVRETVLRLAAFFQHQDGRLAFGLPDKKVWRQWIRAAPAPQNVVEALRYHRFYPPPYARAAIIDTTSMVNNIVSLHTFQPPTTLV